VKEEAGKTYGIQEELGRGKTSHCSDARKRRDGKGKLVFALLDCVVVGKLCVNLATV